MKLWIFIIINLNFILSINSEFICPNQCQCYSDPVEKDRILHLNCKWTQINSTNLETIKNYDAIRTLTIKCSHRFGQKSNPPPRLFSKLRYLDRLEIDRCKMDKLPHDLFYGMNFLYSLIIKNTDLQEIPANSFEYLTNLMSLDLSGNKLRIEPQALFSLYNLLQLDLSNNSIGYLSNVLTNLNKLKVISFSNNLIENVDFRRLPKNLTDLTLRNNKIKTLHSFAESATNLKRLDLSLNELEYIAASGSVNQLPVHLSVLDISDNKLTEIEEGAFKKMASLAMLDLRNNLISEISEESLTVNRTKFRVQLYLDGNPLKCSCANYWILHPKSKSSPIIADVANVSCYHILDNTRKSSLLDADLMLGYLCIYDSNCLDGCKCCQEKNRKKCNCYRVCPSGCQCWGSAGAHAKKLGQNVISCNNVRMDRMKYVPDGVTELHLIGSMWRDKGLAQLGDKSYLTLLNLSDSSITYINKTLLNQFPKLSFLDLSSNRLKTIFQNDLKDLNNLKILYLKNNELEELNNDTLELFDKMQKIKLGGKMNTFSCECDEKGTTFQKWLFKNNNYKKIIDLYEVYCTNAIHGLISIDKTNPEHSSTICPKPEITTTTTVSSSTINEIKNNIENKEKNDNNDISDKEGEEDIYNEDDDDDYFNDEVKLTDMDKNEKTKNNDKIKSITSTTKLSLYDIPTKPPTQTTSNNVATIEPDEFLDDIPDDFFMNFAPNSKAIRTISKQNTTPAPRKDFDTHIVFSVLIVFLLFVVVALICAIASTVYYRLIRPNRHNNQKVHIPPSKDEEIPLNNR